MRIHRIAAAISVAAIALTACNSGSTTSRSASTSPAGNAASSAPTQSISVIMNYYASATQAGFYYAKQLGYYAKQGLNVTLVSSTGSQTTAALVASGKYDIGYADGPTAMEAISKGAPEVIVAPVIQTTSQSIVSLKSAGITTVQDLVGKSVGVGAGTVGAAVLPVILSVNHVNPSSVKATVVSSSTPPLPLLKAGTINAFLGAQDLQDVELSLDGASTNVIPFAKFGGAFLGTSIIANKAYLSSHLSVVQKFVTASLEGWAAAKGNPSAAAAAVKASSSTSGSSSLLTAGTKVDTGLLCYSGATSLGLAPAADWNFTYRILAGNGFISKSRPVTSYYVTNTVTGSAPKC